MPNPGHYLPAEVRGKETVTHVRALLPRISPSITTKHKLRLMQYECIRCILKFDLASIYLLYITIRNPKEHAISSGVIRLLMHDKDLMKMFSILGTYLCCPDTNTHCPDTDTCVLTREINLNSCE